jgi:hypothetical protein
MNQLQALAITRAIAGRKTVQRTGRHIGEATLAPWLVGAGRVAGVVGSHELTIEELTAAVERKPESDPRFFD